MMTPTKDYLGFEDQRNRTHAQLYTNLIKAAFGNDYDVLIGHHICFEKHGDISTENELPSADTLIFDHDIMKAVFGIAKYRDIMFHLVAVKPEERDDLLTEYMAEYGLL